MSWFIEHVHRDGTVLARIPVKDNTAAIGRSLENDLVLDDAHCAAHHARLSIEPDGTAQLTDLGSINGIARGRVKRTTQLNITDDQPIRIGQSLIRIRSSAWPLPPEQALVLRTVWPWALLALACVLGRGAWEIWLNDLSEKSPPYLYGISALVAGIGIWSGTYALLGRLVSGVERFFSHVLIASCGYLAIVVADGVLDLLAFSSGWLWPMQISRYVMILIVALTVRTHLRVADIRHWPALRWAVGLVAVATMAVPLAQLLISSQRWTTIQTLHNLAHPAVRLAKPVDIQVFSESAKPLQARVDAARSKEEDETAAFDFDD